jgi:hypothetical protein
MNAPANLTVNREWLLAATKVARCRIRLLEYQVEEVGAALSTNMITTEGALAWLDQIDGLGWLPQGRGEVEHEEPR